MGDIHMKLYPEECPKTVENFTTHCRNGYYDNLIFHRVIKGFMIQTGDPLGDGTGGQSIWGREFEDEFHKRYCYALLSFTLSSPQLKAHLNFLHHLWTSSFSSISLLLSVLFRHIEIMKVSLFFSSFPFFSYRVRGCVLVIKINGSGSV